MNQKAYIGADNGISGSYAFLNPSGKGMRGNPSVSFHVTPVRKEQNYTKKKSQISRVIFEDLDNMLEVWYTLTVQSGLLALIERPYVNPQGLKATISAVRCLEATLIALERNHIAYQYIDSREWQKVMLPKGLKGTAELKAASLDIGIRLFPGWKDHIERHKDADSLLIAEWARRKGL